MVLVIKLKARKFIQSAPESSGSMDAAAADDGDDPQAMAGDSKQRPRKTFQETAAMRANEVDKLKQMDTSSWTEIKKAIHFAAIESLTAKIEADAARMKKQMQSTKSTATVRAPPMKDDQTRRLIYARNVMDCDFKQCINTAVSKWDMVAKLFNEGFVAK
jgi:hypothetical protein